MKEKFKKYGNSDKSHFKLTIFNTHIPCKILLVSQWINEIFDAFIPCEKKVLVAPTFNSQKISDASGKVYRCIHGVNKRYLLYPYDSCSVLRTVNNSVQREKTKVKISRAANRHGIHHFMDLDFSACYIAILLAQSNIRYRIAWSNIRYWPGYHMDSGITNPFL